MNKFSAADKIYYIFLGRQEANGIHMGSCNLHGFGGAKSIARNERTRGQGNKREERH